MSDGSSPGYHHTQKGPWSLLLYAFGVLMLGLGWLLWEQPVVPFVLPVAGTIMLLLGASFQHLTVSDDGDRLAVRFGPVPLFHTSVRFEDIEKVEVGQTTLLDGWGIHRSLRGGWVWNISGRDCVVVHKKTGGVLRIGTDDAENLARFLGGKASPDAASGRPASGGSGRRLDSATAGDTFATRLYDRLAATEGGRNLFLSPFSVQVALAVCAVGARGETRKVMADLIGAPEGVVEQNRQYASLLKLIQGEGGRPFQLVTANALWGQKGYHVNPEYQKAVARYYGGAFNEVDFAALPDEAVKTINAWVGDKTREKIKELIRRDFINADTRLILTNAIYFKGDWREPFEKADTRDEDWHGPKGTRRVPMMHQTEGHHYHEGDGFQALELPYQGERLSMLVVLPRKKDGLASLETRWAAGDDYQKVTAGLRHEGRVVVSLPRFKMETEFKLKPVLCALGAGLAFGDDADFGGIASEPLKLSEVVHKAFVEVNEQGTEAAAATAAGMMLCGMSARPKPPIIFQADHPFLFFIRDKGTNAVLFSGRVVDPR